MPRLGDLERLFGAVLSDKEINGAGEDVVSRRDDAGARDLGRNWRRGTPLPMFSVFQAGLAGQSPAILAADGPDDSVCPPE